MGFEVTATECGRLTPGRVEIGSTGIDLTQNDSQVVLMNAPRTEGSKPSPYVFPISSIQLRILPGTIKWCLARVTAT